jgi:hypothetical protein
MRAIKPVTNNMRGRPEVMTLFRQMNRELPRVLGLYDIHMTLPDARKAIRHQFDMNKDVKDPRIVDILCSKCVVAALSGFTELDLTFYLVFGRGQQELEETLLQYKQKAQLMRYLETMGSADAFELDAEFGGGEDNVRFYQGIDYKGQF